MMDMDVKYSEWLIAEKIRNEFVFVDFTSDVEACSKNHVAGLPGLGMMDRPSRGWDIVVEGGGG